MSRTIAGLLSLTFVLAFDLALSNAGWAVDAVDGATLAKRWCATCHVVAADQKTGTTQAPPFSAIAKQPGIDAGKIALYLLAPHPRMPDMNLSRAEAAYLAAYIKTQGK
jgi:mono/diheme cytochrome c family protein